MSWSIENAKNDESSKIRWNLVPFMRGKVCLDLGSGPYKIFPKFISVDSGGHWGFKGVDVRVDSAERLPMFASQSVDCVYSSHLLEHITDYKAALREWARLVKPGGHLCLYLPHKLFYPNIGQPGANPDHKHDFMPDDIVSVMKEIGGFDLVENEDRNDDDEYSFWQVYKRLNNRREFVESWKNPKPTKTCAIARFGAQGDMIQCSTIFPWLKESGFSVTVYCQEGPGYDVVKHDPNVDRFIVQERDAVPPQFLGEFLDHEKKKYDKFINLCEAVEYTLLAVPGSAPYSWPNEARKAIMDRNYVEWIHQVAEVPPPYRPKFYSTLDERAWAQKQRANGGKRNILWSLAGSSNHKVWPHLDDIILRIMPSYPDVHVFLVGDESCKILEAGFCRYDESKKDFVDTLSRVHCKSNRWTIRESMAFAEVADLIIGTETGLLNAAGSMETKKIINLSHSSPEMLTKHWANTIVLQQPKGVGCVKSPCRQLHGSGGADPWLDCPKHDETGTALCQYFISPESMWEAVQKVLGQAPILLKRAA